MNIKPAACACLTLLLSCACGGRGGSSKTERDAPAEPLRYTYEVVNTYPHSSSSYTQGLFWHEGRLWESTGEYGNSRLMEVDLETGKPLRSTALGGGYFGEGAALLDGRIYQLTWREGMGFVYDPATLERTGERTYQGEGWGLATDGSKLYMSSGTDRIAVLNPATFAREKTLRVRLGSRPVNYLNEMEWIEGRLWANVFMTDNILIIDPATGRTEGVVDLAGLLSEGDRTPAAEMLNGIAYDPAGRRIFVTGKNWDKLFEIRIKER